MLFAYTTGLSFALTVMAAQGVKETDALSMGSSLIFSLLIFIWYWFDSQVRGFQRTVGLNVAVVAVAFIAIPFYLFRSRPVEQRRQAFVNLGFVVGLLFVSMLIGGLLTTLL